MRNPIVIALCVPVAAVTSLTTMSSETSVPAEILREAAALQSGYYEELNLDLYRNLDALFGESSRVIVSGNFMRFGNIEVRAKLIVPRSDAAIGTGFLASGAPEPVRLMLDYALVSCAHGCEISIVTDSGGPGVLYEARHEATEIRRRRAAGGAVTGGAGRSARTNRIDDRHRGQAGACGNPANQLKS
jgi:hypothetical protein